ncbi:MAG: phosphotransferase family protein [Deltaproteobacteria bacterium]
MKLDTPGEVRADERLDEEKLEAWLRANVGGLDGPLRVEQFHGGHANLTYMLAFGEREIIVRRPPLGPIAPKAHDMGREFRALSALASQFPHSPRPLGFCEDTEVIGASFLVMERRRGYVIRAGWPEFLPEDESLRRRISEQLIDALADLHLVDTTRVDVAALGKPEGFVERQVKGWFGRWEKAKTREIPDMDKAAEWCLAHIPEPTGVSVLHNDYKLDNCMYDGDDPGRLVAIFDWDMTSLGDPLVDLGTLLGYWSEPGDEGQRGTGGGVTTLAGFLTRAEMTRRYAERTGFDVSNIGFYETFALFKTAVVIEQIYVRWVRGQTKDDRFEALGAIVPLLAAGAAKGCT